MKSEKKIFLERTDPLEIVVDRIIKTPAAVVVLNIPRDSVLGASVNNFHVLRRESKTAGKELLIESIDDHVLELAGLAKLEASNPIFRIRERVVSDILPRSPSLTVPVHDKEDEGEFMPQRVAKAEKKVKAGFAKIVPAEATQTVKLHTSESKERTSQSRKIRWILFFTMLFIAGGVVAAAKFLPKATITLVFKKIPLDFAVPIRVGSTITMLDAEGEVMLIPGELLVAKKNLTLSFPAHGKEEVSVKAHGRLVVYNAYNSEPQVLVATTRFESPEGKVFRLNERVTIPGARMVNGSLTSSSLEVAVTADESGEAYNSARGTGRWKIPGFKGTPRYEGFYAEAREPFVGGFIGERAEPTEEDIQLATIALREVLKNALYNELRIVHTEKFVLFPEASSTLFIKEEIQKESQAPGMFSVFGEAEMRELVFEEIMFRDAIIRKTKQEIPEGETLVVNDITITYDKPQVLFTKGSMEFVASGNIVFVHSFDTQTFKQEILGKDEASLKNLVLGIDGLERVNVALRPFWVRRVPEELDKIDIVIE